MASVNHKEPDRVARDMGATPSSGISALAYNDLVSHLGLDVGPAMVYDVVQQLAQPHIPVLDKFHIDVVDIGCAFNETPEHWTLSDLYPNSPILIPSWFHPVKESDGSHSVFHNDIKIATKPKTATFFDGTYVPYRHGIPQDLSDLDYQMDMILWQNMVHAPWDHANEPDFWE
ncbi:MAG: methyltransferase, partial [Eubacteriales bacterium]